MQALHIIPADSTKNVEKVTDVYSKLSEYLEGLKSTKNKVEFKEHEAATVHQMILKLEKKKLIRRNPNTPRSIAINISEKYLPKWKRY